MTPYSEDIADGWADVVQRAQRKRTVRRRRRVTTLLAALLGAALLASPALGLGLPSVLGAFGGHKPTVVRRLPGGLCKPASGDQRTQPCPTPQLVRGPGASIAP